MEINKLLALKEKHGVTLDKLSADLGLRKSELSNFFNHKLHGKDSVHNAIENYLLNLENKRNETKSN